MPLVLSLKQGQDVYVGDEQVQIEKIIGPTSAVLSHNGKYYSVDSAKWMELDVGCRVRASSNTPRTANVVRIQFDSPNARVLRGNSYRNQSKKGN